MSHLVSQEPKKKFPRIPDKVFYPLIYIGVAILILILGILIPGITDEVILETMWVIIIAITEVTKKNASKK